MVESNLQVEQKTILGEEKVHNLGVCYQENVLIPQLSVQELFELLGAFKGVSKEVLQTSIDYLSTQIHDNVLRN